MEAKTAQLFNRLDAQKRAQLFLMMQSAIDEMQNTNIFAQISPADQQLIHDPDPEVRLTNRTKLAMSVGNSRTEASIRPTSGALEWEETVKFEPAWANAICMSMLNRFETFLGPGGDFSGETVHLHIIIEDERGRDCTEFKKLVEGLAEMYGIKAVSFHENSGSAIPEAFINMLNEEDINEHLDDLLYELRGEQLHNYQLMLYRAYLEMRDSGALSSVQNAFAASMSEEQMYIIALELAMKKGSSFADCSFSAVGNGMQIKADIVFNSRFTHCICIGLIPRLDAFKGSGLEKNTRLYVRITGNAHPGVSENEELKRLLRQLSDMYGLAGLQFEDNT